MTRCLTIASLTLLALSAARLASAHCEVPCGIYDDPRRFEQMREDAETISKAITQINELAGTHDATGHNQLARWVVTKEDHATNIQHIASQYFLAQRIKSDSPNYTDQLTAAHNVIVTAMKTKQAADPATVDALNSAIDQLERAYTGQAPQAEAGAVRPRVVAAAVEQAVQEHTHTHADGQTHTHAHE